MAIGEMCATDEDISTFVERDFPNGIRKESNRRESKIEKRDCLDVFGFMVSRLEHLLAANYSMNA
jgi:hypothetical protein